MRKHSASFCWPGLLGRIPANEQAETSKESAGWIEEHQLRRMVNLVEAFGFRLSRVSGSHHIFVRNDVPELVNLQEVGGKAKPYQIRQFLKIVERYNLKIGDGS